MILYPIGVLRIISQTLYGFLYFSTARLWNRTDIRSTVTPSLVYDNITVYSVDQGWLVVREKDCYAADIRTCKAESIRTFALEFEWSTVNTVLSVHQKQMSQVCMSKTTKKHSSLLNKVYVVGLGSTFGFGFTSTSFTLRTKMESGS